MLITVFVDYKVSISFWWRVCLNIRSIICWLKIAIFIDKKYQVHRGQEGVWIQGAVQRAWQLQCHCWRGLLELYHPRRCELITAILVWSRGGWWFKAFPSISPQWNELQDCYKNLTNPPHLLNSTSKIKALVQGYFDKSGINHDRYNSMSSHSECVTLDSEDASAHCACWEKINTSELIPHPELPIF